MCGAFSIRINPYEAREIHDAAVPTWKPIYNARPGEWLPIVTEEDPKTITSASSPTPITQNKDTAHVGLSTSNSPLMTILRRYPIGVGVWGFVPHWMDPTKGKAVINARGETIVTKPYFRSAIKSQRCIIPADGFYEWQTTTKGKIPHFFHRRDDRPFSFAGIYDVRPGTKDELGFVIITTTPNDLVAKVHDRMPVMLPDERVEDWLNPDTTAEQAVKLLQSYPEKLMSSYVVSRAVNAARNKGPEVLEPVT